MEVEVEESGGETKLGTGYDEKNDCPPSNDSRIHRKWKGFCFYAPPPLRYNPAQRAPPTSFNTGPMQQCEDENKPKQLNRNRAERGNVEEEEKEKERKEDSEKESIDTIIENEYTDEMSFLVNKISLTEDEPNSKSFMPYIY